MSPQNLISSLSQTKLLYQIWRNSLKGYPWDILFTRMRQMDGQLENILPPAAGFHCRSPCPRITVCLSTEKKPGCVYRMHIAEIQIDEMRGLVSSLQARCMTSFNVVWKEAFDCFLAGFSLPARPGVKLSYLKKKFYFLLMSIYRITMFLKGVYVKSFPWTLSCSIPPPVRITAVVPEDELT